ncbi:MAG: hypothetical protein AAF965_12025 [Pseudomonadota bacterium]
MNQKLDEIDACQQRITDALDRLGKTVEARTDGGAAETELAELRQMLEDEKTANSQLEDRLKTQAAKRTALEEEIEALREQNAESASRLDAELQSLRRANRQLRDNNAALRDANKTGVGEPHLINKSMMAELEALRAERKADRAETSAILASLTAAIDGAATGGAAAPEDA